MEALQSSIAATCPLPFQGANGQLFAATVAAVIAAHCTFFNDYKWPRDNADEIIQNGPHEFDFIVVGAGTAGSAIAGKLADHNPSWSLLLVEAGDDPSTLNSEVPAYLMENQDIDWKYQTEKNNRSCLGFNDRRCIWNKGKAMGGSSAINAMLYVRGHPKDYDTWRDLGNPGWAYEDLIPYFEAIEEKYKFDSYKYHENPWYDILDQSYEELGLLKENIDKNECVIGTRVTKLATRDGKRLNSAKLYLKEKDNLFIMKNSLVEKIIVDQKTVTAKGVVLKYKNGNVMQILAKKEVILSAGSVATPQILMLSGIGPRAHLTEKGIENILDLPVGQNLQDHVIVPLLFETNIAIQLTPVQMTLFALQYMLDRTGALSNVGLSDYMSFVNTKYDSNYPNMQYHHIYFTKNDNFILKSYFTLIGYDEEIVDMVVKINKESGILAIYPTLLHPKSRGEIKLNDSSPQSTPDIITNYYEDADDIKTLIQGIRSARKLEETETFKYFGVKIIPLQLPGCENLVFDSDEYWECYIRHLGSSVYHPIGTAKMGVKGDTTSVVDSNLMVHGINNLRIVDASIMPVIPGGNTMAATLVIAEKAFVLIRKQYSSRDEL